MAQHLRFAHPCAKAEIPKKLCMKRGLIEDQLEPSAGQKKSFIVNTLHRPECQARLDEMLCFIEAVLSDREEDDTIPDLLHVVTLLGKTNGDKLQEVYDYVQNLQIETPVRGISTTKRWWEDFKK